MEMVSIDICLKKYNYLLSKSINVSFLNRVEYNS